MADLAAEQIVDLVTTTQHELGKNKWTDISFDLQNYVAARKLMKEGRVTFDSGDQIQFNVQYQDNGSAANVGLYGVDNPNQVDTMITALVPWRHVTCNWVLDEREVAMNATPARIVNLVKTRRHAAHVSQAKKFESNFWGTPASSSDKTSPWGVGYWIQKAASATEGFNGGNPTGFSDAAGIDSDTYGDWKNWNGQYTNISKTDLVRKWREAATKTQFMPPVEGDSYNTGNQYGYYCNYDVLGTLEELLEAQNDSLGNDVASKDGSTLFRRTPVTYVPFLDSDSQDPVYGINWGEFKPTFLKGFYMREGKPLVSPKQHNVIEVHVDTTMNYVCHNRRCQFVLNKA